MVKQFTDDQVDDLIKLKFGRMVASADNVQYVSNNTLGKIYGDSATKIRQLYMDRFKSIQDKELPFLQQFMKQMQKYPRRRWGLRFLKPHEIEWLVDGRTLR